MQQSAFRIKSRSAQKSLRKSDLMERFL